MMISRKTQAQWLRKRGWMTLAMLSLSAACTPAVDGLGECTGDKCDDLGGEATEQAFWSNYAGDAAQGSALPAADPVITVKSAFAMTIDRSDGKARIYRKALAADPGAPGELIYESQAGVTSIANFHRDQVAGGSSLYWLEDAADGARLQFLASADTTKACSRDACTTAVKSYQREGLMGFAVSPNGTVKTVLIDHVDEATGASTYEFYTLNSNFAEFPASPVFSARSWIDSDGAEVDKDAINTFSGPAPIPSFAVDDRKNIYYCYGDQLRRGTPGKAEVILQDEFLGGNKFDPANNEFNETLNTDCSYVAVVGTSRLVWSHFGTEGTKVVDGGWVFSSALSSASSVSTPLAPKAFAETTNQSTLVLATPSFFMASDAEAPIESMAVFPTSTENGQKVNKPFISFVKAGTMYVAIDDFAADLPNADAVYQREGGFQRAGVFNRAENTLYAFAPNEDTSLGEIGGALLRIALAR